MVLLARLPTQPGPDYQAIVDALNNLPRLMREARAGLHLTAGQQARQAGITSLSLSRLGPTSTTRTAAACFAWLANH